MNNLMKFENQDVEIITNENGEPLFELYSTGMALGQVVNAKGKQYPNKARIDQNIEGADISTVLRNAKQYLTESMLYDLMLETKTEKVKPFRKWVTHEVLPQIRKTGGYIPSTETDSEEDILAKAYLIAHKTIENKNKVIAEKDKQLLEQKPKVEFADHVATSNNSMLVREVAKIACKDGIKIGERRLYEKLREWGLVFKNSCEATQKAIERELFEVVEGVRESSKGKFTFKTTKVTGKGQVYIINKLKTEMKGENKSE